MLLGVPMLEDLAPAKINLFLHVLGRRSDGYHLLESLVSFADIGDRLALVPAAGLALRIDGPFGEGLAGEADNLVLKAARAFAAHIGGAGLGAFHLTKNLPVASGLGGGSSDAAAALRLMARLNGLRLDDPRLMDCARFLGADVPVCLQAGPRLMRGIGHELGPVLEASTMPALLVNPGIAVETRAVFAGLGLSAGERHVFEEPPGTPDATEGPVERLKRSTVNHLEVPAKAVAPVINTVIESLAAQPGCRIARMSGSGATCFALFSTDAEVRATAQAIGAAYPCWWVAPCRITMPS